MGATGTATLDFGAAPGSPVASVVVTGQAGISASSVAEAWLMAETSADHNEVEHRIVPIIVRVGQIVAGTGFTIYATSDWSLTGQWTVRWVWN
jgi:thiamine monophosphate kinase